MPMPTFPRLNRSTLLSRLRAHARKHGSVSIRSLYEHDRIALRSLPLHFVGIDAAREAAGVPGPAYKKPKRKTGPKPGSTIGRGPALWSRERVIDELRALDRAGKRTALVDLTTAGLGTLAHAAAVYVGGLRRARKLAGIDPSPHRHGKKRWTKPTFIDAFAKRARKGQGLASTVAPLPLVTAGRWHFGSWRSALSAAGIEADATKLTRKKYTPEVIVAKLQQAARAGSDLRATSLMKIIKLEAVRREFGPLRAALLAAGLQQQLQRRKHGRLKWSRERLIEDLRDACATNEGWAARRRRKATRPPTCSTLKPNANHHRASVAATLADRRVDQETGVPRCLARGYSRPRRDRRLTGTKAVLDTWTDRPRRWPR